ncbi:ATP-binding protein [Arthrobacter sp. FW305-BF8]|uniref:ATP-binding protein n=1 Tax=Arthrobacter sp. FW305-BF8 TaxID=2879617 RepID=UPI001F1C48F4|nr:ATP-binding protein [Arthrobacter sp. FW305-BF8]UKA56439.1 ATP-binding protein [Arthrobacter sp. FW305-BF8]
MRAVGYSLETAIADVVDNSIAANAGLVEILYQSHPDTAHISILDDGRGMDDEEIVSAMQLASTSAVDERHATDLGRFGLGLKTASLSQCRCLTVISKKDGVVSGARWDMDHLANVRKWELLILSTREISAVPGVELLSQLDSGTLVVWTKLNDADLESAVFGEIWDQRMMDAKDHLALVFHRFLAGEHGKKFRMRLNGTGIKPADPFLARNSATQAGTEEKLPIGDTHITIKPFTLPYLNKMTAADKKAAQVNGTLRDSQGFYVYRSMRLVIGGSWFRVAPRTELGKLARVRVDIPNTLDHLWALDIKKSTAVPPPAVKNILRKVIDRLVQPSQRAFKHKGTKEAGSKAVLHTWEANSGRDSFFYKINRDHPILRALSGTLSVDQTRTLENFIRNVESSFPLEDAYIRMAGDQVAGAPSPTESEIVEELRDYWKKYEQNGFDSEEFRTSFKAVARYAAIENIHSLLDEVVGGN